MYTTGEVSSPLLYNRKDHYEEVKLKCDIIHVNFRIACELAVSLSKYAGEADALRYFTDFCNGYSEHGRLNAAEISCIPDLIILRILSNVVYFVGRAMAGEDSIDSLTTRAEMYYNRIKWIKEREQDIVNIVKSEGKMKM